LEKNGILIIGLGKSGIAAALLAKRRGYDVYVTEYKRTPKNENRFRKLEEHGIEYEVGNSDKFFNKCNTAVISPGIDPKLDYIRSVEKNMNIISEIEFAYKFKKEKQKLIAITGTNGKSTVTTMIYKILKKAGKKVALTGNIGYPLSDYIDGDYDFFSCEVSSYQLEKIEKFSPDVSVLLNVTPDHLNRYDYNFDDYFKTKLKIFENLKNTSTVVINGDEENLKNIDFEENRDILSFSRNKVVKNGAYILDRNFVLRKNNKIKKIMSVDSVKIEGIHNLWNIMASICATEKYVSDINVYQEVFEEFESLEHRLETVDIYNGIKFINDSKATNIESLEKALESFKNNRIILILGGDASKKSDFMRLKTLFKNKCKFILLIGETKNSIADSFNKEGINNHMKVEDMDEAVSMGYKKGNRKDVVLLSPGAASFDMYDNFEQRGKIFKESVNKLVTGEKNAV